MPLVVKGELLALRLIGELTALFTPRAKAYERETFRFVYPTGRLFGVREPSVDVVELKQVKMADQANGSPGQGGNKALPN
jgi:hypothetical protein